MMKEQPAGRRFLILAVAVLATAWGAAAETNRVVQVELTIGRVLRVNTNHSYIILQCGSLPLTSEEAKVCRGGDVVARVRISKPDRFPFLAADVLEGDPREGDTVKQVMWRVVPASNDGGKE